MVCHLIERFVFTIKPFTADIPIRIRHCSKDWNFDETQTQRYWFTDSACRVWMLNVGTRLSEGWQIQRIDRQISRSIGHGKPVELDLCDWVRSRLLNPPDHRIGDSVGRNPTGVHDARRVVYRSCRRSLAETGIGSGLPDGLRLLDLHRWGEVLVRPFAVWEAIYGNRRRNGVIKKSAASESSKGKLRSGLFKIVITNNQFLLVAATACRTGFAARALTAGVTRTRLCVAATADTSASFSAANTGGRVSSGSRDHHCGNGNSKRQNGQTGQQFHRHRKIRFNNGYVKN